MVANMYMGGLGERRDGQDQGPEHAEWGERGRVEDPKSKSWLALRGGPDRGGGGRSGKIRLCSGRRWSPPGVPLRHSGWNVSKSQKLQNPAALGGCSPRPMRRDRSFSPAPVLRKGGAGNRGVVEGGGLLAMEVVATVSSWKEVPGILTAYVAGERFPIKVVCQPEV